jgi:hypothetical protein
MLIKTGQIDLAVDGYNFNCLYEVNIAAQGINNYLEVSSVPDHYTLANVSVKVMPVDYKLISGNAALESCLIDLKDLQLSGLKYVEQFDLIKAASDDLKRELGRIIKLFKTETI